MTERLLPRLLLAAVLLVPASAMAQLRFQEGRHYTVVTTPQASGHAPAGKIEVTEVFSYLCGSCYQTLPIAEELEAALPADAAMVYVHGALGHADWRLMQQGHVTARLLGIADRNHARMFTAIWETGEFPQFDLAAGKPRKPAPVLRDVARFYAKGGGVTEADFLKKASSPEVQAAAARTEALIRAWQVGGTPTFVVAGRYRIENDGIATTQELKALVNFLVGRERSRLRADAAKKD